VEAARAKALVEALVVGANALNGIASTASRNRKSLSGTGYYANRFHDELVKVTKVENLVLPVIGQIDGFSPAKLVNSLSVVKSTTSSLRERADALKQIVLWSEADVLPNLDNLGAPSQPRSEPVLPVAVFATAPTYFQRTLLQANGCYEHGWFEASSVMIRKLVENLIIDVYEKHQKQAEIQKDGDYLMLAGLVAAILSQTHWPLQRETKRAFPDLKKLGDRAAHNRRYWATKADIDNVLSGLRAATDDLLHLAGHK
jgi:hypothetical protein